MQGPELIVETTERDIASTLSEVLDSEQLLLHVSSDDFDELIQAFTIASRRSGLSVYAWTADTGLISLRESGISVPGSRLLAEALRYVLQSMHFGVYLFHGYQNQLIGANVGLLRQIAKVREGHARKVVLISPEPRLPATLAEVTEFVTQRRSGGRRPRLRDGRWIEQ